ncbi:MAG TPA: hypothetical protein VLL97_14805 [Acidobacteriota bacterium]|nr:hypothetical protein [Acidobacteriota bacterium]
MNCRRPSGTFVIMIAAAAVAIAGVAPSLACPANAAGSDLAPWVERLPRDGGVIFGVNLKKATAGPAFGRIVESRKLKIVGRLMEFAEKAEIDPTRDIAGLAGVWNPGPDAGEDGAVIFTGTFDREKIESSIRSSFGTGVVFLDETALALGDIDHLEKMMEVNERRRESVAADRAMMSLVEEIDAGKMFWFAGEAADVLAMASMDFPLGPGGGQIRKVAGAVDVADDVAGAVIALMADQASAEKLAETVGGLILFAEMAGDADPDVRKLLKSITVTRKDDLVRVDFSFPLALYDRLVKLLNR